MRADYSGQRLFRLELDERGGVTPRLIEFEAHGRESTLIAIDRCGTDRVVAIFEEGRQIARVRAMAGGGAWLLNPPRLQPL